MSFKGSDTESIPTITTSVQNSEIHGYGATTGSDRGDLILSAGGGAALSRKMNIVLHGYGTTDDAQIRLQSGNTPIMTLLYGGNVGIGATVVGAAATGKAKLTIKKSSADMNTNTIGFGISVNRINADVAALLLGADTSIDPIIAANNADLRVGKLLGDTFSEYMRIDTSGNVGIGTTNPGYKLEVNGSFQADSKSFEIDHPTKPGMRLVHGCIEGPEYGVYYRGEGKLTNGKATIALPDYFEALTREEGRTVQLTAKGEDPFLLSYSDIAGGEFTVHGTNPDGEFSWEVKAIREDIEPLEVEKPQ